MVNNLTHLQIVCLMEIQDYVEVHCQKKCENPKPSPLPTSSIEEDQDSWIHFEFDLKIILTGYGSWLVIGVVVGNFVIEKILHLFLRSMGRHNIIREGVNLEKHYLFFSIYYFTTY